ncbi:MAG: ribosome silencing factor [bacterium]|nr:ribosome silencing factor [bacterium]
MKDNIFEKARLAAQATASKKAEDIVILNVGEISSFTDYLVICSGRSKIQVQAIADAVEEQLAEAEFKIDHREGYKESAWILLDYGDVIVNIFHYEAREFYQLEELWAE